MYLFNDTTFNANIILLSMCIFYQVDGYTKLKSLYDKSLQMLN